MKPKIVLLATGGTIASRYDASQGSTVVSRGANDLLTMLPEVAEVAAVEVQDFASIPSYEMSVQFAFGLAGRINEVLGRPDVAGVVVTHGTDTMEETSYLSDLLIESDKPAVFTGAQRANDDPQTDGPFNLRNALRLAASPLGRGLGAVICFNGMIHAARDVTKMHSSAVETFQSYQFGALGEVDGEQIVIHRQPTLRKSFRIDRLEERVDLIRLVLGIDLQCMVAAIQRGVAGFVIEAFGRGNGPARLTELVGIAVRKGLPVLITSRCIGGRVQPIYGGGGGGCDLIEAGGIFAGDLKGSKARLLLMVLLSSPATRPRLAEHVAALAP
ncbi:MAG: asparaginase [Burkholderiales bacterium]